ncbi:MAG TPA: glycoside hydrolase family 57 [Candidatus Competibacter phosphatis]|jgi:alpha-amylase/alpha-mannosidase (GH57 family)|nr:glycoside hydrolase family 57 [Candidatus Competibacter sp.]HMQ12436.1 glycoside hydrolase family 57 [Candidatus Competibacter phosphatis]HMR02219.1 glycoside hydrolase family 57 [Candidatus Competibacter phosphatis]
MADTFYHALVLNLHQPPGNLEHLWEHNEWEAREILFAMDRIPRSLWDYQDIGRIHLALSGTLLEVLSNPDFQNRVYGAVDCGSLLWYLQNNRVIDILGTGYYHPVLPLIPPADWEAHLDRWQRMARHLFFRGNFQGFWPPEMGFCMEMIPLLRRLGYRFVLVDCEHVRPVTPMSWQELRYRPHIARFGGEEIVVIVRDRELSNAQESGMELEWFVREVQERTKECDFAPLVTTCTDGGNGGWFRNVTPGSNFWDAFYKPLLNSARAGQHAIRPAFIKDYLDRFGADGEVTVGPGAWNTGWHDGRDFLQWKGSQAQQDALTRVDEISQAVQAALRNAAYIGSRSPELLDLLEDAHWRVLRAETSCNFFWGDAWVMRCHADLDQACECLERANACFV